MDQAKRQLMRQVYDLSIGIFWPEAKLEAWQMPGAADKYPDTEAREQYLRQRYQQIAEKEWPKFAKEHSGVPVAEWKERKAMLEYARAEYGENAWHEFHHPSDVAKIYREAQYPPSGPSSAEKMLFFAVFGNQAKQSLAEASLSVAVTIAKVSIWNPEGELQGFQYSPPKDRGIDR